MKDDWTEEATRVHQYGPSGTGQRTANERPVSYDESSTVVGNRESLMALVSASMTIEESDGTGRAALPVSRDARNATAAGTIQSFPFGHDDGHTGADRTPPPIQTRQDPSAAGIRVSHTPRPSKKGRLGPHLPITLGIVASFVVGLALNNEPAPKDVSPPPLANVPAGPLIQPRTPPAASMPAKATLKITSSPAGAYVTVDGEVAPTVTPREVPVKMGTWVTLIARRPGFRPSSRAVLVQEAITSVEIPLEKLEPLRSDRR
jgi:PEGA domain